MWIRVVGKKEFLQNTDKKKKKKDINILSIGFIGKRWTD
jgi:hypothetical protein